MHATDALREADRLMTVCNACRYCEGLCAVFPAMEMRTNFASGDLNYLANLCHACGACFYDCQYAPPHEFHVNVPKNLAEVRNDSYQHYAWPGALSGLFEVGQQATTDVPGRSGQEDKCAEGFDWTIGGRGKVHGHNVLSRPGTVTMTARRWLEIHTWRGQ